VRGVGETGADVVVPDPSRLTAVWPQAPPKERIPMPARQQQTVQTLLEALPYIRRFSGCTMVVEIAGATLWSPGLKASFAGDVALLQLVGMKPIVVHPATDVPTHRGLIGLIGMHGGTSIGLESRAGAAWLSDEAYPGSPAPDLTVESLAHDVKLAAADLVGKGVMPVIACEGGGEPASEAADKLAGGLAAALSAEKVLILSDAGGLYDNDPYEPRIVSECDLACVGRLQAAGAIEHDMLAAVAAVRAALEAGVTSAHIIDGRVEHALLLEILTDAGCGTKITLQGRPEEKVAHIP
jgi:acetylglutamate kinase